MTYDVEGLLTLSRSELDLAGRRLAERTHEATKNLPLGETTDIESPEPWIESLGATRIEARQMGLSFMHGTGVYLVDEVVDDWIRYVVARKGGQHEGIAARAILAVVQSGHVDAEDLTRGWARLGTESPWWRVYVVDPQPDRGTIIAGEPAAE